MANILDTSSCLQLYNYFKENIESTKKCIILYSHFKSFRECTDEFLFMAVFDFKYILNTYKPLDQYAIKKIPLFIEGNKNHQ